MKATTKGMWYTGILTFLILAVGFSVSFWLGYLMPDNTGKWVEMKGEGTEDRVFSTEAEETVVFFPWNLYEEGTRLFPVNQEQMQMLEEKKVKSFLFELLNLEGLIPEEELQNNEATAETVFWEKLGYGEKSPLQDFECYYGSTNQVEHYFFDRTIQRNEDGQQYHIQLALNEGGQVLSYQCHMLHKGDMDQLTQQKNEAKEYFMQHGDNLVELEDYFMSIYDLAVQYDQYYICEYFGYGFFYYPKNYDYQLVMDEEQIYLIGSGDVSVVFSFDAIAYRFDGFTLLK